jgi:hypothetical protein
MVGCSGRRVSAAEALWGKKTPRMRVPGWRKTGPARRAAVDLLRARKSLVWCWSTCLWNLSRCQSVPVRPKPVISADQPEVLLSPERDNVKRVESLT